VIQFLLESKTQEEWKSDQETLDLFNKLFNFCLNSKDAIKSQGIRSFMIVCQKKDLSYFSRCLSELETAIFKIMDQADFNKARTTNCLNFLNCVLQVLPVSISQNIVKKLLDYTEGENVLLKKNIYFVIETMFAATKLSSDFVEDFLGYLLDNVPVATDSKMVKGEGELMIVGYCLAVAQVAVHYKKLNGEKILPFLPSLVSILSEYLISGEHRIKSGAFTAIKNLIYYSLESSFFKVEAGSTETELLGLDLDLLTIRDENTKIHPIKKISLMFAYCLNSRFESCYSEVLKLITTFVDIGGEKTIDFGGIDLLTKVGDLAIKKTAYKAWIECQGKFLEKYKSERFFSTLPMKLLDFDMNSESYSLESRSYLIPVVQKYSKNESLHFFVDNFVPLIELLTKTKNQLQKEKQLMKYKKYETLICQIWEIMPNYLQQISSFNFSDTAYLSNILAKLDKIIEKNLYTARTTALKNLISLIGFLKSAPKENLKVKKSRVFLMKKAIGYITSLSKLYIESAGQTDAKKVVSELRENEHMTLLKTISHFGWLCKKTKLNDLFFNELTAIIQEFTDFETDEKVDKNGMELDEEDKQNQNRDREASKKKILRKIDIIICLMEQIRLSKKHCELIIQFADNIAKSKITQKKAFKILSIILQNYEVSTYAELQEMFSKLTGYAFNPSQQKQKLLMFKIFLSKIKKPQKETDDMDEDQGDNQMADDSDEEDPESQASRVDISDEDRLEITNTILPEVITGFSSLQAKSKKISEGLLIDLIKLHANHFNEFLKKLLAGFAGDTVNTRAATINILTRVLKMYKSEFSEGNLKKIAMIIILFLKESSTYLQRSVLMCLKRVLTILPKEIVLELCPSILKAVTEFDGKQKLNLYVKYVVKKFIRKLGKEEVKKHTPEDHLALVDYCDKMIQKMKRMKLRETEEDKAEEDRLVEGDRVDEFKDSDAESSSDEDDDDEPHKADTQIADYDIPIVRNIKVRIPHCLQLFNSFFYRK
jgi:hypothetical protein